MLQKSILQKINFLLVAFLFAAGQFSFAPPSVSAKATAKKSIVSNKSSHREFEEYEAVVKIDCADCLDLIAEKYNVYLSPLGGEENENFYLAKSLSLKSAKKLVKVLEKDRQIELVQPNFKYKPLTRAARDTYYSKEWWLFDSGSSPGGISAALAWDLESKNSVKWP